MSGPGGNAGAIFVIYGKSVGILWVNPIQITVPFTMIPVKKFVCGYLAAIHAFAQCVEKMRLVRDKPTCTTSRACAQTGLGYVQNFARQIVHVYVINTRIQGAFACGNTHSLAGGRVPTFDKIPRRIKAALIIHDPDPESGQRA